MKNEDLKKGDLDRLETLIENNEDEFVEFLDQKTRKKAWWKSKTVWLNFFAVLGVTVEVVREVLLLYPETTLTVWGLTNLVLRVVTKTELIFENTEKE